MDRKIVVLAGATGHLGNLVARALADKNDTVVRALVRPGSAAKAAGLAGLGVEVVETAIDGSGDQGALDRAMEGAFSVVSALQGGPDIIVGAQSRLLEAAARAGASRFIPSDFSMNMFGLAEGENINLDIRRAFARQADGIRGRVSVVHVLNGCFIDTRVLFGFLGAINLERGEAYLWGEGNQPMDFTTFADTARFTAEAATDPNPVPAIFNVAGDSLNFHDLVKAYEEGSGKSLTVVRMGSLADMDAEIAKRQRADPQNMYAYIPLMYWRGMLNGKGKLGEFVNDRNPIGNLTTVKDYVRNEGL
ncbi:NmrA family NAD(P)-binding protein [Agrobacterium tumefaciens]|uniref:NmrA family NAD(P)-binding protein n=1 Tax=Agrobacterium tumefaciens TaxID=358 RepID=UPI0021D2E9D6|nr:NmrA family NAD(P)-binding protein [Agrobacterium tumefaciens]NTZ63471.1 NmrA family NAD(P)-binding protein [Agrobacterium tumefaciens]UXT00194.1 NmrA family NAD(P)-binding protein [Agrobacterium tumefaciens]UXT52894.1 NmrA family NAD(P)-binding protein [Agrobacterium tumefaciens]